MPRDWFEKCKFADFEWIELGLGQTSAGPHVVGKLAETFLDTLYE